MSKHNHGSKYSKKIYQSPAQNSNNQDNTIKRFVDNRAVAQDTFSNPLARLGINSPNLLQATEYPLTRITRDYNLMNSLYRNSWIAKKIINTIPDDMVKNWYSITAELTPDETERINKLERKCTIKDKIREALYWGRLYGGAAAIMMIKGHEDKLEEPLDLDDVMPNSFKGLMVVDRWSGIFAETQTITDIENPEFGLPEYYGVRDLASDQVITRVHHSRVLRFVGRKLPYWENLAEIQWGASELEHVFDELAKRDNTSWNIAALVFQANLLVNKVDGLDQLLSATDPQIQRDFYNVKSAQNQMRNNNGMMIIGKNDEIVPVQYTFAGLNDIYESFMLDIAGAAEIPVTKLFGRSPAGMNATGESDLQNYYDKVAEEQSIDIQPVIDKLLPVEFMSEFGKVPDDLGIKFNPVATPSDEKMADIVGKKTASIVQVYSAGLITQKIGLRELKELSYTTNMFSSIEDDDIEKANDSFEMGGEMGNFEMPPIKTTEQNKEVSSEKENEKKLSEKNNGKKEKETETQIKGPKKMSPEEYTKRYGGILSG